MSPSSGQARGLKVLYPGITIVVLIVGFFVAERLLVPPPPAPPKSAAEESAHVDTHEESAAEETPSAEEPAPADDEAPAELVEVTGPLVTPVAQTWSTYHGGPELTGLSDAEIPENLEVLWRFQADGALYYAPVADENGIYVCTFKGEVYGLDFEGNQRWRTRLVREVRDDGTERMERIDSPVAAFLGKVFVSTLNGKVYALDSTSGETAWTYEVEGPVLGTVNLLETGDGPPQLFVIGQDDGALHSFNGQTGERIWKAEATDRCDGSASIGNGAIVYGSCAAAFHVFSAEDGTIKTNIELDPDSQVASGAAIAGNSVFGGSHSGRFFHVDMAAGNVVWINEDAQDEIFTTPAVTEDTVVFASYDGNVYALDRATGALKWKHETLGFPTSAVIASGRAYLGIDGVLTVLDLASGEVLWTYEVSDEITSPAIIGNTIVVGGQDGSVMAFGAKTDTD
jgi:eukaryotic-like serine/threonine-protein kinase